MKQTTRPIFLPRLLCLCLLAAVILPLFACGGEPTDRNCITSVVLKEEKITVEALLTDGFLDGYTEKQVYLFELPSLYSTDADLSELDPVASAKPKAALTFTLSASDGVRSRLYSSFVVASYDPTTRAYTALTTPASLTNPEAAADYAPPLKVAESSIKGLISDYPADAVRLGVSHTVVDVSMDKLILADWREGAVPYVYNGVTRYLDGDALAELDETVGIYTAAGVEVYLRFILGSPDGKGVPIGLYLSTAAPAEDYAVNMTTAFSASIMEGFFDYMAAHYACPADGSMPVSAFVLGYRVNNAATHHYAGNLSLSAFVTNYEKLTRVAHTAIKSHNPEGRVYISLDSRRAVSSDGAGWDVEAFLSAFRDQSNLRGDYGWHVACELYADTPAVWEENAAADAAHYTVRNLGTLTDLLDSSIYRMADTGEPRRLLISGFEIPAVTMGGTPSDGESNLQAASYAFAYLTCVRNGRVEALVYSTHVDDAVLAETTPLCGLWTVKLSTELTPGGMDLRVLPATPRPIYDVFKQIDTTGASSLSAGLTAIIGAPYTNLETALAGGTAPVTAIRDTGKLQAFEEARKKVTPLYTFGDGSLHGFADAGNLTYLELADAEVLGTVTLHARFDRSAVCDPMGLTVTLPATHLIGGKEMMLDLFAGEISPTGGSAASSAKPTVTLRLTRAATGNAADGHGEIIYEATVIDVKGSAWQTAVFDISAFTALLDASDEVTMTLLMDYPLDTAKNGDTAHNLGLAGVYITGNTAAAGTPVGLIAGVVMILVLLVAGVFTLLLLRHRKKASRTK